jgi:iron complex transport system substrate-binding protein
MLVFIFAWTACEKKESELPTHVFESTENFNLEIIDARGETIQLRHPAIKVVSLLPSLTEYIFELDKDNLLIGRSEWCRYPQEALAIEAVGSLVQVDKDRLTALNPDVVLVSRLMPDEEIETIEALGCKVIVFDHQNWESIRRDLAVLGKVLGNSGDISTLISWLERHRRIIQQEMDDFEHLDPVRTAVLYSLEPLSSAGKGTFVDEFIHLVEGVNIATEHSSPWPTLTMNFLTEQNPEVLLISTDAGKPMELLESIRELAVNGPWAELEAVKNNRIYLINGDILTVPGPRQIRALAAVAAAVRPELFEAPQELQQVILNH